MSIADVISWKFNNQPGMRCKEINGVITIVEFPGGIPSQSEQDAWTDEYIAAGNGGAIEKEYNADINRIDPFLKALALALNDGTFVPGSNLTGAQLKAVIKSKL